MNTVDLVQFSGAPRCDAVHIRRQCGSRRQKTGELAQAGEVGKRWMFSTVALERYLAGEWIPRVVQDAIRLRRSYNHVRSSNVVQSPNWYYKLYPPG